ncbi:MAG: hypothetical protein ACOCXP_01885 [Candidatus Dojkabacteria bacterium]
MSITIESATVLDRGTLDKITFLMRTLFPVLSDKLDRRSETGGVNDRFFCSDIGVPRIYLADLGVIFEENLVLGEWEGQPVGPSKITYILGSNPFLSMNQKLGVDAVGDVDLRFQDLTSLGYPEHLLGHSLNAGEDGVLSKGRILSVSLLP